MRSLHCGVALMLLACSVLACTDDETGLTRIVVIDGATGEPLWRREIAAESVDVDRYSPADEIAVYGYDRCTTDGPFQAFDARSGKEHEPPPVEGYPSLGNIDACAELPTPGKLISTARGLCFYEGAGHLVALEIASGEQRFDAPLEANEQSLALEDELFVLTTRGGSTASGTTAVSRLSLEDGSAVWTLPVHDQVPQVGDTVVYLTGPDDEIVAVTREDGDELWRDELSCETLLPVHDFLVCMQQVRPGICTYEAD